MLNRSKPVGFALQGGGAHGAFTWGVLDRLFEDGRLAPRLFTGASAGAMNAVVAADGWLAGGPDGARERLAALWNAVAETGGPFAAAATAWTSILSKIAGPAGIGFAAFDAALRAASPQVLDPLNLNPLRDIIAAYTDFPRLRRQRRIRLYVSATDARSGRARVFEADELTPDVLLASACLPTLFRTVEIDGAPYWDGGYAANPPLLPLLRRGAPADVVLAPLNPDFVDEAPTSPDGVLRRISEIGFHAPYLGDLRALAVAKRMARGGPMATGLLGRARRLRLHPIAPDDGLEGLGHFSKHKTDRAALDDLFTRGRDTATRWLRRSFPNVGVRPSVDLETEFLSEEPGWER